jgi:integrase
MMSGKKGHRAWGSIKRQRTKRVSYQASFVGPDLRRHYAPHTFTDKMNAEAWLLREKNYRDQCLATGERWRNVVERDNEKKARGLLFGAYGAKVLEQRKLKDSSRLLYEDKWEKYIEPHFGNVAVKDMSAQAVRAWFAGLDSQYATRNAQAYTVLSMICATAVDDGLLIANPCTIKGATTVTRKPKGEPLSINDVFAIANWLGEREQYRQYKHLVLIAAFCGGTRIGEAVELRRKDVIMKRDGKRWLPTILKVERQAGATQHRTGQCNITTTKAEDQRRVDIPKLIQDDVLDLLSTVPADPESLLFRPIQGGTWQCDHLNSNSFNANILKRAAKEAIGRTDVSPHDLRHFAATFANEAGLPVTASMARTGHKSKQVHLDYIDRRTDNGKEMADRISDYALTQLNGDAQRTSA